MFKQKDPYTVTRFVPLYLKDTLIGNISLQYQVTKYDDVQLTDFMSSGTVTAKKDQKYLLLCTQKMNIYNKIETAGYYDTLNLTSFDDYPALITALMSVNSGTGLALQLVDYSPQTINTQVQASGATGSSTGTTQGSSVSNTVGSSISQTNSYGTSVTVGDISGVTADYQNSTTISSDR